MAQTAEPPPEPPPAADALFAPAGADAAPREGRRAWSRLAENWPATVLATLLAVAATVAATMVVLVLNGQSDRISSVEDSIVRLEDKMDAGFADVDAKFAAQDEDMAARFAAQDAKIDVKFAAQDADIDRLEDKIDARFAAQDAKITRLEDKMDAKIERLDVKIDRLDDKVGEISLMLAALIASLGMDEAVEAATAPG